MSVNTDIIAAVSDLAPCYPWDTYDGSLDDKNIRYFTFTYFTMPFRFGDGGVPYEKYFIQLHYFCPTDDNTVELRKSIKSAIYGTGCFTWPTEESAGDEDGQHYVFEFEGLDVT